jgi:hypothetical protein
MRGFRLAGGGDRAARLDLPGGDLPVPEILAGGGLQARAPPGVGPEDHTSAHVLSLTCRQVS